jgi:hypothetical protein
MPQLVNLRCSLIAQNITNIVYWSLDQHTHDHFLNLDFLSIFLPGFPSVAYSVSQESDEWRLMMKHKPTIISMLLELGLNVWFLDTDVVVIKDFREKTVLDSAANIYTSVYGNQRMGYIPTCAIMYFRYADESVRFLSEWISLIGKHPSTSEIIAFLALSKQDNFNMVSFSDSFPIADKINIKQLNPSDILSGKPLFDKQEYLDVYYTPQLVHATPIEDTLDKESREKWIVMLIKWGLWFVGENKKSCSASFNPALFKNSWSTRRNA